MLKSLDSPFLKSLVLSFTLQYANSWGKESKICTVNSYFFQHNSNHFISTESEASLSFFIITVTILRLFVSMSFSHYSWTIKLNITITIHSRTHKSRERKGKMDFDLDNPLSSFKEQQNCTISELFASETDHMPSPNSLNSIHCEAISLILQVKIRPT